jgi:hypothetical protein
LNICFELARQAGRKAIMARTMVKDFFNSEMKGNVNDAVSFVHNGDVKKTFTSIDDLYKYNEYKSIKCDFGAYTDINFQYDMILSANNYETLYNKECTRKNGYTSNITCVENSTSKLYSLASYGFKVEVIGDNKYLVTSPKYKKLTSFRRIADGCIERYFNIENIHVVKFEGNHFIEALTLNGKDLIKECQYMDRGFLFHEISNRVDKSWN